MQLRRETQVQDQQRRTPHNRHVQQTRDKTMAEDVIRRRLEKWKGVCIPCHQVGRRSDHSITRCPESESRAANQERGIVQSSIEFPWNVACYRCGVPRAICERWENETHNTGRTCQFYGILVGVVYGAKHACPEIWSQWVVRRRRCNAKVSSDEEVKQDLGSEAAGATVRSVWLLQAFMWITERMERSRERVEGVAA